MDRQANLVGESRQILKVHEGKCGLQQSEMVFQHTRNLPEMITNAMPRGAKIIGVCASGYPRPLPDSYMPAFLVGAGLARSVSVLNNIPLWLISHQENHLLAGKWSAGGPDDERFLFLHASGGTTNGFNSATSNNAWIWGLALPSESVANLFCFTAHMSTENAWSAYGNDACRCINSNLYNSIDLRDFRRHSWLDPDRKDPEKESYDYKSCRKEGKEYFNELPDYANIKFRPAQGAYEDFKVGGAADHPYMRVEEMYFIEAEAKAHENLGEGIRLLNEFMNGHRIVGGGYDCTNMSSSVESFTNELMLQKRIEFWGEGIVMFDMKRLDMSTRRGYVGTNSPNSYRLNTEGRAPYWNFVITRGETQNNPVIATQNNPDPSQTVKPWNG